MFLVMAPKEKLERQAAALGIEDKITFHGYSEETDSFMANSSCLLFRHIQKECP